MTEFFKACLVCLIFILSFYGITFFAFRIAFGKKFLKENFTSGQVKAMASMVFIGVLFCVYILSKNDYVYTYDSAGYWTWSYKHMKNIFISPYWGMSNLWDSIITSDYNLLLPTIISLPLKFLGYTFNRYVFINFCIFVIPSIFLAICLARKIITSRTKKKDINWIIIIAVAVSFYLTKTFIVFQGYIDVALLIPVTLIISIIIDYDCSESIKRNFKKNLMLSILLVLTFLFRRYSAFFIISFFIALSVISIPAIVTKEGIKYPRKIRLRNTILNIVQIGGVALAIMLIFFHKLIFRILGENYSELYSAYNDPFFEKLLSLFSRFGAIFLTLAILGIIFAIRKRRNIKAICFCALNILITVLLFFSVQRIDGHHALTLIPQLFALICFGLNGIIESHKLRKLRLLPFILIFILLFEIPYCYISRIKLPSLVSYLFVQKYSPLYRPDMKKLHEIKNYINTINNGESTYVLSGSTTFNQDTLGNLDRPYVDIAINGMTMTYSVDLRDGFPDSLMTARFVVTAEPTQTHLKEGSQETIRYFSDLIKDENSYFGRHFRKLNQEFEISKGVTVLIYEKTSDFTKDDYEKIYKYFTNLYPDAPTIFADRIEKYING